LLRTRLTIGGIVAGLLGLTAAPARGENYPGSIPVPAIGTSGPATRYPANINFLPPGGLTHRGGLHVTLHKVTHPCPEHLAVLLVHAQPAEKFLLMSNAGGCRPLQGTDIAFVHGLAALPDSEPASPVHGPLVQIGVSNYGAVPSFPAPAPPGPYTLGLPDNATLNAGTWLLYVIDTTPGERGVIAGGWSLQTDENFATIADQSNVAVPAGPSTGPGAAQHYPITFNLTGARDDAEVHFVQLTMILDHPYPDNMRILLESPSGTKVIVMANAGGVTDLPAGTSLHFTDAAAGHAPNAGGIPSGTYQPGSTYEADNALGAPAPQPPYATQFSAFDGDPVKGTWRLWVYDDASGNAGHIASAVLRLATDVNPMITALAPAVGTVSTQPFILAEVRLDSATVTGNQYSATWRVVNPLTTFYEAGLFSYRASTNTWVAEVPLKKGTNTIAYFITNPQGYAGTASRTVTVNEFTYSLSEGATGGFFDLDVTLGNVNGVNAPVTIDFLPEGGAPVSRVDSVTAATPLQLRVDDLVPDAAVSTIVHSTNAVPLAVERTMSWDARGYGGHGGGAVSPNTRWLFAEGSQGFFDTYVLLANDGNSQSAVNLDFLLEGGGVISHGVNVPAHSRRTVYAGEIAALVNQSFGIDITASQPIVAERSMYFPHGGARVFEGGHESAGVNEAGRFWLLAEGATGPYFECFVLMSNPNPNPANVTLTYLLPDGDTVVQNVVMAANSRQTVNIETVDPKLVNTPVSTRVSSDIAIVVERAMYWPDASVGWQEAHNGFGLTQTGLRWGVADGRIGGERGHETYILLANSSTFAAEVDVTFMKGGGAPIVNHYTLPPTSRHNIQVSQDVPTLGQGQFTAEVSVQNYIPIAVEKAMYWNADGVTWAAGTNVAGTRLPPP
jgi:subtilisin-like proprotein convertase family protein